MKKISLMKKLAAVSMSAALAASLAACTPTPAAQQQSSNETANEATDDAATPSTDKKYTVGICQLVQHEALDAATTGFKDVLLDEFGENVSFDEQNAAGDSAQCVTICTGFAANGVDLILGNATPALQAAASSTSEIPVLGTSITEYGVALSIDDFSGTVGGNISGTSDLAPLDQQADMITELVPDAQNVGILYCSAEANSVYQSNTVQSALEAKGLNVTVYTFSDSNDVASVTESACSENDVLYIPTDNTAASCTEAINNVALPAGVPIVCGEEGLCKGCGIATLSIDYYELGRTTGAMAVKILKGESNISDMPVEYYTNPVKKYNADICSQLGIKVPEGYEAISND
ncbi:ABC transporter substrate-binding protein [Butyrivibrio sp. MC2013]|uniref:ABC transporter substrate-binding protein n=1 Tax=Butyrivibrio sp. MC2013 TaxID=1280686 RepID=UPI00040033F9|nr:ABC transporter substrate-binding protein [Butyrivibrio sp. MC2013]